MYKLNIEQKELIEGKQFAIDSNFHLLEDKNGDWFISIEEVEQCNNPEFSFVKKLQLTEYEPLIIEENEEIS